MRRDKSNIQNKFFGADIFIPVSNKMKIILSSVCLFLAISIPGFGQSQVYPIRLSGTVSDNTTGEFLPGVAITTDNPSIWATTDETGRYDLIVSGTVAYIRFSYLGYATHEVKTDSIGKELHVRLVQQSKQLGEVVVSSRARDEHIARPIMGAERMNVAQIRRLPALLGEVDALKAIQLLPGVQSSTEGTTGFSVRGGMPDQNLILLDNTTIYNASHLLGFFSIYNNDVIGGLELYKGDLPLQYGGRLASLLSVETKSEIPARFGGSGGIGLISARALLEGPIGDKTSWLLAARRSYADLFFGLLPEENMRDATLYFYDVNAKLSHRFSTKDKLELNVYHGTDRVAAEIGRFDYGNTAGSLTWRHASSERFFMRTGIHISNYDHGLNTSLDESDTDWTAGIFEAALKIDFSYRLSRYFNLDYGFASTFRRLRPGTVKVEGYEDYVLKESNGFEHAFYLSNEQRINERITLRYGMRWSLFQNLGPGVSDRYDNDGNVLSTDTYAGGIYHTYSRLEPRANLVYRIGRNSSIKASYARNTQYIQLAENSSAGTPISVWFTASPNIKPQSVDILSMGYFRNFKDNMYETSVEVYYKNIENVIDFAEHASLLLNQHLEGEIRTGTGRAYGVEVMARKNSGRLTGFVNYTWSRAERTIPGINNGKTYLAPYDKTHAVNISANYALSHKWSISATWTYSTGTPTTYPTGRFDIGGESFPIFSGRNEYRKPDYHRLDLAANFVPRPNSEKRWRGEWSFSLYNAYGRKNPWLIVYEQEDSGPTARATYLFRFMPSVTYNFKF